jgi:hypothetical protein
MMSLQGKTYRGVVMAGRGFGRQRMSQATCLHALQRFTNLTLVPGTLNVRLACPFDAPSGKMERGIRQ